MKHLSTALAILAASSALALPARGALPPRHGGELTLPAPEPIVAIDPLRARTHFEATLADAVYDGLYETRGGAIAPVLAEGPPVVEGTVATVRLRPGVLHHGGRPVSARHVVRSIARATAAPEASWLLATIATENGRLAVREIDGRTVEIALARPGVPVDRVLAARTLAIVVGGSLGQRPIGTGPFRARLDGRGGAELSRFRYAPDGAPWIDRVRVLPPSPRDDEVRAFELGRLDGSWWGRSLYGGEPVRPVATASATSTAPVLLVPNRARALRDDALFGGVAATIDRRRLERVGLTPHRSLGAGLPAPDLPEPRPLARGTRLVMLARADQALETRLSEAIAGLLDERGVRLTVERVPSERYDAAVQRGAWDLRLALVRPPLPGRGPLVGAALAAAGQIDRARRIALALDDTEATAEAARTLGAMILGHERVVLHHRADLSGLELDALGRVPLADLSFARSLPEETP